MNRIALLLFLLSGGAQAFAQNPVAVGLNENGLDTYFEKSRLIAPVFRLTSDSIEGYLGFGVENKEALPKFRVTLPPLNGVRDTGYSFLFSKVFEQNAKGYTAVLIANYSRRNIPAVIFVDHNNNYDFTDDGDPDTFYLDIPHVDIELRNPLTPERKVIFRLSRFSFTRDLSFKEMADELFKKHSGTKEFVGCDFSFREQRFNIRKGDCVIEGDSFNIALQDVNYNGLFNEPGIDRVLINKYGEEVLNIDHAFPIARAGEKSSFERRFKSYEILKLDSFGRAIHFRYDPGAIAKRQLREGKKVPRIHFTDSDDKKVKLRWFRRKPVYIYFYNREAPEFAEDTAALRIIQEKFCPMIKVIALNYGDYPKNLPYYVDVNDIPYLSGIATKSITQLFQVEQIPYGFLLKKRLRLFKKGLRPAEVLEMLERGEIQSW